MKSVRFNDLSKASQIFAESFVEEEPEIKSRKNLNESVDSREESKIKYARKLSENGKKSYVLSKDGRNRIAGSEEELKKLQSKGYDVELVFENGRTIDEALSDEAKANNEMIQKILNKKPSQLTAKEKKFLADNDLVRYSSTGGQYTPNIRRNGASWSNSISKGDRLVVNRGSNPKNRSAYSSLSDVDQLNLLKKRDERSRARHAASKDPDILEPWNYQGNQGPSKLQDFNKYYEYDIKNSKEYAKRAKDDIDSYIETGSMWKAGAAMRNADYSRKLKDRATKNLEYRPKFESYDKPRKRQGLNEMARDSQIRMGDRVIIRPSQTTLRGLSDVDGSLSEFRALKGKKGTIKDYTWEPGNRFDRTRGHYLITVELDDGREFNVGAGDLILTGENTIYDENGYLK